MTRLVVTFDPNDTARRVVEETMGDDVSVDYLPDRRDEERTAILSETDLLLGWSLPRELEEDEYAVLSDDQVLQTLSAGVDHVPLDRLPGGMTVLSNAGTYAEPMAEHVLAMYLALAKRLAEEDRQLREDSFNQFRPNRWVRGSRCVILGFGTAEADDVATVSGPDRLETVLNRCDVLVVCAPLTPETRGLIDREKLGWMGDDAILINVVRGEIVDQRALYEHLVHNPSFRAGIDAWWTEPVRHGRFEPEYPLLELPNVLGSSHNASMVPDVMETGLEHALNNLRRCREGKPENVVDPRHGY